RHYEVLNKIGNLGDTPEHGFLRAGYSAEETAAMKYVEEVALRHGFRSEWDAIGNLALESAGEVDEWVEAASHLDTVPYGGNFDGAAGVIAGLEAVLSLAEAGKRRGIRLRVWRNEE